MKNLLNLAVSLLFLLVLSNSCTFAQAPDLILTNEKILRQILPTQFLGNPLINKASLQDIPPFSDSILEFYIKG